MHKFLDNDLYQIDFSNCKDFQNVSTVLNEHGSEDRDARHCETNIGF